ncbi:Uncharacterised protein [Serratia marcescens]|nr:Uncharacterised protein [Serratia marcescens]
MRQMMSPFDGAAGSSASENSPSANTASPMQPSRPACTRSTSRPAIGAMTTIASGHGVSSSPVATSSRLNALCRKNGSDTIASICAANEQIEVPIDRAKIGMRSRSTGSSGNSWRSWRRTNTVPIASSAAISLKISVRLWPWAKPLMAVISRPKVSAFSTALVGSKRRLSLFWPLAGRNFMPSSSATRPIGRLMANSHCQEATDRIAAATVGPAAEEQATISELMPMPRPRKRCG